MLLQPCVVQVTAILNANEVGDLEGIKEVAAMPGCDLRRHGLVRRDQLVCGQIVYWRRWVGLLPWSSEQRMVEVSKIGISLPGIIGIGQPAAEEPGFAFLEREIPLSAFHNTAIGHDAGVAKAAGKIAEFYLALLSNDIADKRYGPILGYRNADRLIPLWVSYVVHAGDPVRGGIDRRVEDDSSGRDPVFPGAEIGLVT